MRDVMLDKLAVCSFVIFIFSFLAPRVLGLPLHSKTENDVTDFDLTDVHGANHEHKRAAFLLNGGANSREDDSFSPHRTNGTNTKNREGIGLLRIRRSSDDYNYEEKHEDYYEGGGAEEVGGGRKRMIAFTIFFLWVCWVFIACSILRLVAKNMA
ncbi:uncharacterized protein LOC119729698 [Patiria miniata]|uniref:Transmembrane protein n=1 Tax=Patiria miniata TaxID=46514 RepID=A0A914A416_PATMI|nr:uncharacterized protein LOC119729698 [Patiria miniata]